MNERNPREGARVQMHSVTYVERNVREPVKGPRFGDWWIHDDRHHIFLTGDGGSSTTWTNDQLRRFRDLINEIVGD